MIYNVFDTIIIIITHVDYMCSDDNDGVNDDSISGDADHDFDDDDGDGDDDDDDDDV